MVWRTSLTNILFPNDQSTSGCMFVIWTQEGPWSYTIPGDKARSASNIRSGTAAVHAIMRDVRHRFQTEVPMAALQVTVSMGSAVPSQGRMQLLDAVLTQLQEVTGGQDSPLKVVGTIAGPFSEAAALSSNAIMTRTFLC